MSPKLQEEIKQTKPFASREEEVHLNIVRTAEYLADRVVGVLKASELTGTQYNALRILRGAGATGATCGEIAERMVTKDPDITRLLDRLETRKLITRARCNSDRRVVRAHVTESGLALLSELDEPVREVHRRQLGHLGQEQLAELSRLLETAREDRS
ncbi:MAG: MarR family transcriptional regulator [Pyrinomonadaceae bacterium]